MKVLIVDDDKWYGESLAASLQSKIKTKIVFDAETAIEAIDDFAPDAILLDFYLGAQNALVLLNELQSYSDIRQIPVIILSGNSKNLQLNDFKNYGVKAILDKATTTPEEVLQCLKV